MPRPKALPQPVLEPFLGRPTAAQRAAAVKAALAQAPLDGHAEFRPAADRDPVGLLLGQSATRIPDLVPVRHGRMLVSPFAFFRGAALPMAADLATMPNSGLWVQLGGDAHLANFGAFASPERHLLFGMNDFDETHPGPFEWDVKRLAASIAVASRENGYSAKERRQAVLKAAASYRSAMNEFVAMPILDVWYAHLDLEATLAEFRAAMTHRAKKRVEAAIAKARTRDSLQVSKKMTRVVDGVRQIIPNPPLVVPIEDLTDDKGVGRFLEAEVKKYRESLREDRRVLFDRYRLVHAARKVVGVGSVGTQCWILLFDSDDDGVLFLQYKEAQESVLSPYLGATKFGNHGRRVVEGQLLIQAVSDIFLGWQRTGEIDYYVRQLRDWKFSAPIETFVPSGMAIYATICAWTLARAHARTGDRFAIAAYLGSSNQFEHAIVEFAEAYADQTELDYFAFGQAAAEGQVKAVRGL